MSQNVAIYVYILPYHIYTFTGAFTFYITKTKNQLIQGLELDHQAHYAKLFVKFPFIQLLLNNLLNTQGARTSLSVVQCLQCLPRH